ncbi:MAG: caspase family protein, partial [Cyclobacteriaceae bacterium]|nr:caspase family protein [Cyclobacteriaceae bacterium]
AILWDLTSGELITEVKGHRGSCSSCISTASFFPDGKSFITVARDDSVRYWNARTGKQLAKYFSKDGHEDIKISRDGKYFGTLQKGIFYLFNYTTGQQVNTFGKYGEIESFDFSPDGKGVVLGGKNKTISILHRETFKTINVFSGYVNAMEDSLKPNIRTWIKNINAQVLSPSGKLMARGKIGHIARIWDVETGRIIRDFKGHTNTVTDLCFSPDGKYLATASADNTARVWEVETGRLVHILTYHGTVLFSVAYNQDGSKLLTGGWDGLIVAWDSEKGIPIGKYKPHDQYGVVEVSFSPNGLYIISGGLDQRLVMTEFDTGKPVREFIGHSNHVVSIAYSPDGKYMLTGSWDGLAKLWDLTTGLQVQRFGGHQGPVYDVSFNIDGKFIGTASMDKTARIWDPVDGKEILKLEGHKGAVTTARFHPRTGLLYTGSRDGSTKCWNLTSGKEIYTHIFTGQSEWIVKVPDGHFYATEGAKKSVFFVRGIETYNIERFYDNFYTPGLLDKIDKSSTRDARGMNLMDQLDKYPPPTIEIMSPKPPFSPEQKKIEIMLRVTNNGGGVEEIKILQNGKRIINDRENLDKINKKGKSIVKLFEVELVPGNNVLEVTAFSTGRIETKTHTLTIFTEGEVPLVDCYIFAIGINRYKNPTLNLNYAEADAKSFVKEIKKSGARLFNKIKSFELLNEKATKDNILQTLTELKDQISPNDVFYFYYAGHGSIVESEFYFIPFDNVRLYDKENLQQEAITARLMQEHFREIRALKQVLFIDACHSGGSTELLAERGAAEEKALAQLSRSAGIHILAAAGSEQTAAEFKDLGHGLFTYMILEALKGNADGAPLDNKVTVYELKSFLDDQVPDYSKKYKGSPQYPSTFSRGHDFPVSLTERE